MTAPPMKYAEAPGMERSAAEIRPPAEDSATARVSLRATRRAATDAEREERFSGIVLGTSLGSEPAHCARSAERVSNRRTFRAVDPFAYDEAGRRRQAHGPEPGTVRRRVPPHPEGHPGSRRAREGPRARGGGPQGRRFPRQARRR